LHVPTLKDMIVIHSGIKDVSVKGRKCRV